MTLLVRDIAPADHDAWRALFHAYGVFYETELSDEVLDHVWSALLGGALRGFVAEQNGRVVGIAHVRTHVATFSVGEDWYLEDLFVDPEARAGGVGTAILEHLIKIARYEGGGTLRWVTAESNATAQWVYDKLAKRTTWVTYEVEL
ncbi:GNAT family N-acetyltransferase [Pseudolysinimonas yzui]|uniref:GCN5 family N-acetyltransferase n=1 Tax=Pseudolysinimonas yzui TaxID=2708254 RepID=A0A8J3GQW4_9MICO|nr:GNAT family N-acetyltransferase [Pseudolysinimonas yzui]GHF16876.1 GCN5 family N-acetyltransferase [Pseudolysinimonas yzui]